MAIILTKSFSRFVLIIFTIFAVLSASPGWAEAASSVYGEEEILIKLKDGVYITDITQKHDLKLTKTISKLKAHKVKFRKEKTRDSVIATLSKDSSVQYAQPNYIYTAIETPNDPSYNLQWGLPRIKANLAWDISMGDSSITVAIVDTGVDASHPDLSGSLVYGYNAINNTSYTDDDNGHGTHVAGIASGIINNSRGIAGVAGKSRIMPIKVLSASGSGYTSDIGEGIMWAADRGAKVINLSLGGPSSDKFMQDAVNYAYNKGALIIAAAGNSNTSVPSYPAALNNVVAVSATDQSNNRTSFSNYGSHIDLAAPGVSIYSTTYDGLYGYKSGTSMAAPFVAGAAALIWSLDTNKSPYEIESILKSTAYDIGILGWDEAFGYGLIDVYSAAKVIKPAPDQTPSPGTTPSPSPTPMPTSNPGTSPSASPTSPVPSVTPSPTPGTMPTPVFTLVPIGNIDSPSDLETISGTYNVKGWFLDKDGVSKIEVFIDGQLKGQAVYGDPRPDIGSLYPQYGNSTCGFHYSLDTTKLTNGTHILSVKETSTKGTQNTLSGKLVIVSNGVSITPSPSISPSPTPNLKSSNINYYLSESGYVTITIHDSLGKLVKTLENGTLKPAGLNKAAWDGTDSAGKMVPDGVYTYKISVVDISGLEAEPITGTIIVERFNPSITSVSDGPDPLNPAKGQANTISYSVSENAKVTIKIYDQGGSLVRNLLSEDVIIGANKASWDGKNDEGSFVTNGNYRYDMDAVDSYDKRSETVSGTISIGEVDLPVISDLTSSPDPFMPDGKNSVTISYNLSKDSRAGIEIYDSSNTLIRILENGIDKKAGANSITWDGKSSYGMFVPDGSYVYKITAIDKTGFEAVPKTGIINVSGGEKSQLISSVQDSPDPFVPDGKTVNTISFILSKEAQVKLYVYNKDGNLVKKLADSKSYAGTNTVTWNGQNDLGAIVESGTYTYIVTAVNTAESMAQKVTGTVTVDSAAPVISSDSISPNPFIPTDSNNTTLTYTLSEDAKTTVTIYDSIGNKVIILDSSAQKKAGVNTTLWDGKNASGIIVPKSTYSYKIEAVDAAGLEAKPVVGTIAVSDDQVPLIYSVNDTPDPFKPNGKTYSTILFTLSKDVDLTLNITNSSGALVKKLASGTAYTGNNAVTWNGQNDAGVIVGAGKYTYTITAVDKANNKSQKYSGSIAVDMSSPGVTGASFNPNPFTPNGTNTGTLSYTLSENASVTISIYDSRNTLVRTLENNTSKQAGLNSALWDGKNSSGIIVPDGNYTYKIEAIDPVLQTSVPVTGIIMVDGRSPLVTNVNDTPDPFAPDGTKVSTISFALSEDANVKIGLYDINNKLIKTLRNSTMPQGTNKVTWDGKDSSGKIAANGLYTYSIEAQDNFGNQAPKVTGTLTVDVSVPVVTLIGISPNPFKSAGVGLEYIFFNLSDNALTTIKIYDSKNLLVKTIEENKLRSFGANHAAWNGTNLSGKVVPDGKYYFKITAKSLAGLSSQPKEGIIHIIKSSSLITTVNDSPDPFKPSGDNVNTISFTLDKRADVSLKIYDGQNNLVRTLFTGTLQKGLQSITWNGKDESGSIVDRGIYIYRLTAATNNEKESSDLMGTITIDFETPEVKILNISSDPFVPGDDNNVTVTYSLSKKAPITVEIFDSSGNPVNILEKDIEKISGVHTAIWDGRNSSGGLVDIGTYKVTVTAKDDDGSYSSESGYINVIHYIPVITWVKDSPDPFNPEAYVNTIEYTISKDAVVSIRIYDSNNNLVTTLFEGSAAMGTNSVFWNGRDSMGRMASDGTYTYTIDAVDFYENKALPVSGTITVDTIGVEITDTFVSLKPFVPDGTNEIAIFYPMSEPGKSTVSIYDASGTLVRELQNKELLDWISWNGKDASGKIVNEGNYTYKIMAEDRAGNITISKEDSITIKKFSPILATNFIDFEDDPDLGGNLTWNPDFGKTPESVLKHYNWLISKGIKIDGSPDGFVWSTKIKGVDTTGNVVGFSSSNHLERDQGISDNEILSISFANGPVDMVELELTVSPALAAIRKQAEVLINSYDANGNIIDTRTQMFIGLFNEKLKPVRIKIHPTGGIAKVTIQAVNHPFGGVWVESLNFAEKGSAPIPKPTDGTAPGTPSPTAPGTPKPTTPVEPQPVVLTISQHGISPNPFDPTVVNFAAIVYTLSTGAKTSVAIYDNTDTLVKTLETGIMKNSGRNSAAWDGKNTEGLLAAPGTYKYKITAANAEGTEEAEVTGTFAVSISTLTISSVSDTPDPFGVNGTKAATIKYNVSKSAVVTIKIYDSSNNLVRSLINGKVNAGSNSVTWDGKNQSGNLVKDGKYTYTIDAQDPYGNKAKQEVGTIDADVTPPRITQHFVDPQIIGL
ncbi:MAG: FlgD immunoglobulin-like domain containing protein [Bacillota bacterium]